MDALVKMLNNILDLDLDEILGQIYDMQEFEELVIDLNTNAQLFEGVDSKGRELGRYSPVTIEIKKSEGKFIDEKIRLKDTGDFYKSFKVRRTSNGFDITADAQKDDTNLVREYGKDILGLTDLSISQVQFFMLDEIIKETEKRIYKGL